MTLAALITTYGYPALLLGTFLEGETILLLAGFLAHRGYLELPWVIGVAFLGTFAGDQLFFYLGRFRGSAWLERRAGWHAKAERVFRLLHRHHIPVVVGFRFLYGLRSVTPFVLGASRLSPLRFFLLNALGGIVWASVVASLGYAFGNALESLTGGLRELELWAAALICAAGLCGWLFYFLRRRARGAA